jgi:hypothetical protein
MRDRDICFFFSLFFLLAVLGFEFRSSHLPPAMLPAIFALVIFEIGSPAYAQGSLDHNPPVYVPCGTKMTSTHHHTQIFIG